MNLNTALSDSTLVGPLPRAEAGPASLNSESSLVRIGEVPAGGMLIQEIAALYETAQVNLSAGTARGSSDTAHIGLLRTPSVTTGLPNLPNIQIPGGVPALPGLPGVGVPGGVPAVPGIGAPQLPAPAPKAAAPALALPGAPSVSAYNRVDLDAIHGLVSLSCDDIKSGLGSSSLERLNKVTKGSQILGLEVPDLNIHLHLLDSMSDGETTSTSPTTDHAWALHVKLLGSLLPAGVLPAIPGVGDLLNSLVEVYVYEAHGTNLTQSSLTNATASASVDMLHIKVLDKKSLGLEADIKIGHAEASLSNCGTSPTVTPTPTNSTIKPTTSPFIVDVSKAVESINGNAVASQVGLGAQPGQEAQYSLDVFNRSTTTPCAITKVVDTLPPFTTLVSNAGDFGNGVYDSSAGTVTWQGLSIPNGVAERQGVVIRFADNAPSGTYINRFTATGTCGSFTAVAPGIDVNNPASTQVLGTKFTRTTPRTGLPDTAMWILGGLSLIVAIGGAGVLRRA